MRVGNVPSSAMKPITNPFTMDDYGVIVNTLALLDQLIPVIQRSENCGNDCEVAKDRLQTARNKLEAYKRNFFKGGKPLTTLAHSTIGQSKASVE